MKQHTNSAAILLNPLRKRILYAICRLVSRSKDKSQKDHYFNLAQRFRLWAFPPGSHELVTEMLDAGLDLSIRVNICELVGMQICAGVTFEPHEMAIMKALIQPGDVVFDVGANIGIHSLTTSRLVDGGSVYAFEPASFAYQMLLDNLQLNDIKNVKAVRSIVTDEQGEMELYINSESALTSLGQTKRGEVVSTERVPGITIDNFASKNGVSKIDFLKIDVEGYEGHVLRGAENLLANSPDLVILCELAEKNYKPLNLSIDDVVDWVTDHDYGIWEIDKASGRLIALQNNQRIPHDQNYVFLHAGSSKEVLVRKLMV